MMALNPRTALVCMPFGVVHSPAIGISLLKAELAQRAIGCDIHYFNLELAARIGLADYNTIASDLALPTMVGEWLLAPALYGENAQADQEYVQRVLWEELNDCIQLTDVLKLLRLRAEATGFVEACFERVDWSQYAVVGFSVGLLQSCASLALARLIKAHFPQTAIVFGGPGCADPMGAALQRAFPFIDYVCSGEGDVAFPRLVEAILRGEPTTGAAGFTSCCDDTAPRSHGRPDPVVDLDALPYPDYGDYFAQLASAGLPFVREPAPASPLHGREEPPGDAAFRPLVPMETTRGCWWGRLQPCRFCGMNGNDRLFRRKSPARARREIDHLKEHYGRHLFVTDNIIDFRYFDTLLPDLAADPAGVELQWHVKVNLKREQVALLAQAGVRLIQPGIESLSDAILRLMNKGTTCLQNIQTLKWCKQHGIRVGWNVLYGIPGEDAAEYHEVARLVPLLLHLDAPKGIAHIRIDRYSTYFDVPAQYGIRRLVPSRAYKYIHHALSDDELAQIAYIFCGEYADDSASYTHGLLRVVAEWQVRTDAALDLYPEPQSIHVVDTRAGGERREHEFTGLEAELYLRCDAAHTIDGLLAMPDIGERTTRAEVEAILARFVELGLMVRRGARYLSLAVIRDGGRTTTAQPCVAVSDAAVC